MDNHATIVTTKKVTFINLIKAEKLLTPNLQCVLKKTIFKFKRK